MTITFETTKHRSRIFVQTFSKNLPKIVSAFTSSSTCITIPRLRIFWCPLDQLLLKCGLNISTQASDIFCLIVASHYCDNSCVEDVLGQLHNNISNCSFHPRDDDCFPCL